MKTQNFTSFPINYLILSAWNQQFIKPILYHTKYSLFLNKKKKIETLDDVRIKIVLFSTILPNTMYRKDQEYVSSVRSRLFASQSPNVNRVLVVPRERWRVGDTTTGYYRSVYPYIPLCACTGYAMKMLHSLKIGGTVTENRKFVRIAHS